MRPIRSFLVLLLIIICLTGVGLICPKTNILPDKVSFLPYKNINKQAEHDATHRDTVLTIPNADTHTCYRDTAFIPFFPDSIPEQKTASLESFLDTLNHSSGQIRILHYGDSQIEGDRMTSYLRSFFRNGKRGTGPGMLQPLMPVMYTKSTVIQSSSNWKRYNYLSYRKGLISHNKFGPFMTVCRYMPEGTVSTKNVQAFVKIRPSVYADSCAARYDHLKLLYNSGEGKVKISITANNNLLLHDTLSTDAGVKMLSCSLNGTDNISIVFSGHTSPDIYAISLESDTGIIVDNIPQRGSTGLEFTMVDRQNLKESFDLLKPDLIILQYGLNIANNIKKDYSYYSKGIERQLDMLHDITPGTPVMIAGITNMACSKDDSIMPYPNIPAIVKAQKDAAINKKAAFWDAYKAMGDSSSSVFSWRKRKLLNSDYTHLTNNGADTMAKMMVDDMFTPKAVAGYCYTTNRSLDTLIKDPTPEAEENAPYIPALNDAAKKTRIGNALLYNPEHPMIFTDYSFWLFLIVVLAGYGIVYKRLPIRNLYLLIISMFYYMKTGGLFLILLMIVTVVDYICSVGISRHKQKRIKRIFLSIGIIFNLLILCYFKYTSFIVDTVNSLLGTDYAVYDYLAAFSNSVFGSHFNIDDIILPIGISFFIFQAISYMVDIYHYKVEPVKNIFDFGFYISFFPQLVAGPIVRASEFVPQITTEYKLTEREFGHSVFFILKGLVKKIVISDFIAVNFIDKVFDMPELYSGFENLMAVYGYALQIYCDFSGYTDIAIGLALLLGFRLPVNFNSPYKASNLRDFWKRWHISLSRWLKDYLYIPLGGNRKGKIRTGINIMITMLLGGLWHGASLKFVLWGGLHGTGLIMNKIFSGIVGKHKTTGRFWKITGILITFNFICFCWIFFRASDIDTAIIMLRQIFGNFNPYTFFEVIYSYKNVFLIILAGYVIHFIPEKTKETCRGLFIHVPLVLQITAVIATVILLCRMKTIDLIPFIYFRF